MALDKEKILDLAQKLVIKGQPKKAIAEYIKLIEADPKDTRLYLKLGDLYFKIGEHEKAVAQYMKLAALYTEEDLNSRAISIYKKVLAINPKNLDALHNIAKLYLKEDLSGVAKNYFLNILEIKPDDREAKEALRALEAPPAFQKGERDFLKARSSIEFPTPESSQPRERIKTFDDKSDLFPSTVVELSPSLESVEPPPPDKDSEMHYHLGIAYKEMELFDYAIAEFEKAASNPSIQFDCYIMLGSCFYEKGDYDQAIQRFKEATQIRGLTQEKLARLHFNMGLAYEANGMISDAIENFDKAFKMDPSFTEAKKKLETLSEGS